MRYAGYVIFFFLVLSKPAFSRSSIANRLDEGSKQDLYTQPLSTQKNTLSLGLWKGFPILKMDNELKPSTTLSPVLGYHYFFNNHWMLGMMGGFLRYDAKPGFDTPLHLLTLKFDSTYLTRIYHPLYFGIGAGIGFLFPSIEATLPLKKHPTEFFEIGGHFHGKFIMVRDNADRVSLEFFRFRGTKSYNLYSNGTRLSYSISI